MFPRHPGYNAWLLTQIVVVDIGVLNRSCHTPKYNRQAEHER